MTEQRVVILDGSHSLFTAGDRTSISDLTSGKGVSGVDDPDDRLDGTPLGLRPISGFAEIVMDSIREVTSTAKGSLGKIAPIDVGVVCEGRAVRALGRAIHDRVRARLKS